ncbi:hypothetical protein U1Q18_011144 [Sarracenia purpurea var. burkii]
MFAYAAALLEPVRVFVLHPGVDWQQLPYLASIIGNHTKVDFQYGSQVWISLAVKAILLQYLKFHFADPDFEVVDSMACYCSDVPIADIGCPCGLSGCQRLVQLRQTCCGCSWSLCLLVLAVWRYCWVHKLFSTVIGTSYY